MLYLKEHNDFPPLFEAVGCICAFNGKVLLLKRVKGKSYPEHWGIPSGKLKNNETRIRAIVRELFEETGILLSSSNLELVNSYHIVYKEMSFLYTVYKTQLESIPNVNLVPEEHTRYAWFNIDEALQLKLMPDLDNCLKEVFPSHKEEFEQLELFSQFPRVTQRMVYLLEETVREDLRQFGNFNKNTNNRPIDNKPWYVSFGPPATGKTTAFKAMAKKNSMPFVRETIILKKESRLNFYLRRAFFEGEKSFFFNFQIESLAVRFWMTVNVPTFSLVDETIFTTLAYSKALYRLKWLTDYEYQAFYTNYLFYSKILPKPSIIFYFDCEEETMMKRISRRHRKHEVFYSMEYLTALRDGFSEVAWELSDNHQVVLIDTDKLRTNKIVDIHGPALSN